MGEEKQGVAATTPATMMRSQEEVSARFVPLLKQEGKVYRKIVSSYIRKAKKGEHIITFIDGVKETQCTVEDDNSWVVCGKAAGEYYVLTDKAFQDCYDEGSASPIPSGDAEENDSKTNSLPNLRQQGFVEYHSKRKIWARRVDDKDMDWFHNFSAAGKNEDSGEDEAKGSSCNPRSSFEAPWGEEMIVEQGDYLVTQYPGGNDEVYRIEYKVFGNSYARMEDSS